MGDINTINKDFEDLFNAGKELLETGVHPLMNEKRNDAIKSFLDKGIPYKHENYKYTDLRTAFAHDYKVVFKYHKQDVDLNEVFKCEVPDLDTHMILTTNGWYYLRNNKLQGLPEGVIVCSLQEASVKYPEIFEKHYSKYAKADDSLVNLNTAFAQDGIFVYVPKNVVLERTLQVVNLMRANSDLLSFQRNLIIIEDNAQAKVLLCDHTLSDQKFLSNNVTEVSVGKNAFFDIYSLQSQQLSATQVNSVFIRQDESSNVMSNTVSLYGGIIRNNIYVSLEGERAENETYGMYLTDKNQHVDNFTVVDHVVPQCISNEHFKGVLDDESTVAFTGRINVKPNAQKTEAFQNNNNLLLSDTAKVFAKPQLVIDADDVKCSHGATVGQIDEDATFYLRSRGIGEKEARMMMMFAFTHEIIGKIRIEPIKNRIGELVEKRLRGELSKCTNCAMNCNK